MLSHVWSKSPNIVSIKCQLVVCRLREYLICKLLLSVAVIKLVAALFSCKLAVNQKTCTFLLGDNFALISLNSKLLYGVLSLRETLTPLC